jgi:uncharacterized protein with NRDE domain
MPARNRSLTSCWSYRTNITEPYANHTTSRGHLLRDFLLSQNGDENALPLALESLEARNSEPYAGFNMLLLEPTISPEFGSMNYIAAYVTNHGAGGVITSRPLAPAECRCGGLSNGIDGRGADSWPKVQVGIEGLHRTIFQKTGEKMGEGDLVEGLFELLRSVFSNADITSYRDCTSRWITCNHSGFRGKSSADCAL